MVGALPPKQGAKGSKSHVEQHFAATEIVRDIVIGMSMG